MRAKTSVALSEQAFVLAKSLVEAGRYATLGDVVQHGLDLVAEEEASRAQRLDTIRADLDRRACGPSLATEEMDELLRDWRSARDRDDIADLA